MKTPSKKNKGTQDEKGETYEGDPYMSKSNVADLPLTKSNVDQHLIKSNKSEDGKQGKNKNKKKKPSEESKHREYNTFKINEFEDDDQRQKMKKKRKVIEGNTVKECNDFRSNGDEDGKQENKMKKKKKKPSEDGAKLKEYNDIISNEGGDGDQGKTKKKGKLSHKRKSKENNDFNSNEGDADACFSVTGVNDQGKKIKKKKEAKVVASESPNCAHDKGKTKKDKPSHKGKSKENNDFNSNECDADACFSVTGVNDPGKKMKKKKEAKAVSSESPNSAHDKTPNSGHNGTSKHKRVTFVDEVETHCCDGLVRGKRFTPEEDEKIKASVMDYIDSHGLGDEGLDKILHCKSHPEVNGCWKEIAKVLPERPVESVYIRAHSLLENSERCKWTPDELEFIQKTFEQYGPNWRLIADALGKSRHQVRDAWRRLKYTKVRKGHCSQEEYQNLFNLVNVDLRVRALEPYKRSKHGMLRDNICWEAIAHKLETRNSAFCCQKWYGQLTSPMVASGDWCDTDDYRLINTLYTLDACCMEEVDWDDLLEHRSGEACRKRWDQMVQHIGEHTAKSFIEQVEILTKRFCPDLLEAREAFDNKPVIC